MNCPRTLTIPLLAAVALLPAAATAQQTLLDQQPSQLFSLWDHAGTQSIADQFVVSGSASLGVISWWGGWDNNTVGTDSFDIYVHQDNPAGLFGTEPGAVIASYLGVAPAISLTGANFPAGPGVFLDELLLEVTLPAPLSLPAGIYWVEIFCTGSSGTGVKFNWEMAPQDPVLGAPCMAWSLNTPGSTWWVCTPLPETDMALKLEDGGPSGPVLAVTNLVAGSVGVITVDNATPGGLVRHGYSLVGGGPTTTPFGDLLLSPPYTELPGMTADAAGHAGMSGSVPVGTTGASIWFHAIDLASQTFTNGVAAVIG